MGAKHSTYFNKTNNHPLRQTIEHTKTLRFNS